MTDEELDELITPIAERLTLQEIVVLMEVASTRRTTPAKWLMPQALESLVAKGLLFSIPLPRLESPLVIVSEQGLLVAGEVEAFLFGVGFRWESHQPKPTAPSEPPANWLYEESPASSKTEPPSEARAKKFAEQRKAASFRKGFSRR